MVPQEVTILGHRARWVDSAAGVPLQWILIYSYLNRHYFPAVRKLSILLLLHLLEYYHPVGIIISLLLAGSKVMAAKVEVDLFTPL